MECSVSATQSDDRANISLLEESRVLTGNYLGLIRVQRDAIHRPLRVERARVRRTPKVP